VGPLGAGKAVGGHNLSGLGRTVYMCVFAIMVCNDSCQPYHITLCVFFGTSFFLYIFFLYKSNGKQICLPFCHLQSKTMFISLYNLIKLECNASNIN